MIKSVIFGFMIVCVGLLVYLNLSGGSSSLTVKYSNISQVDIYKGAGDNIDHDQPIQTITQSGQSIKLHKGLYTAFYTGNEGYDSRYVEIPVSKDYEELILSPNYTDDKLSEIYNQEKDVIRKSMLTQLGSKIRLYEIQPGKLVGDGTWFITTLWYKGGDVNNKDSLRVVLKKSDGSWVVKTNPPQINLSKQSYPDIPREVLVEANSLPVSDLSTKGLYNSFIR